MIASVVARFEFGLAEDASRLEGLTVQIAQRPEIEIGGLVDQHSLPMTIDHQDKNEVYNLTRWLQSLAGIEFVDVVMVCLEDDVNENTANGRP